MASLRQINCRGGRSKWADKPDMTATLGDALGRQGMGLSLLGKARGNNGDGQGCLLKLITAAGRKLHWDISSLCLTLVGAWYGAAFQGDGDRLMNENDSNQTTF